jgi:hypothetical protein
MICPSIGALLLAAEEGCERHRVERDVMLSGVKRLRKHYRNARGYTASHEYDLI